MVERHRPAENVAQFDRQMVTRFFKQWYTLENLLVVAAGDFDTQAFAAEIEATFG